MVHECVIGILQTWDRREMVTLDDLQDDIDRNIKFEAGRYDRCGVRDYVYTLRDYGDLRKKTNLRRFLYCPECGNKIDWGMIRRMENGKA